MKNKTEFEQEAEQGQIKTDRQSGRNQEETETQRIGRKTEGETQNDRQVHGLTIRNDEG